MIDSAPSICGSLPPRNACLRQRPRAQWAPEGLWETHLIDNCLVERQGEGGWGVGWCVEGWAEAEERKKRMKEEGSCLRGRDGRKRWVTEGKGGPKKRGRFGGFRKMVRVFSFPSEIENGIAATNSSLSSLPLPSPLFPSHLGLLILPSDFRQRLTPLHTSVSHHYAKVTNLLQEEEEG